MRLADAQKRGTVIPRSCTLARRDQNHTYPYCMWPIPKPRCGLCLRVRDGSLSIESEKEAAAEHSLLER
jgi:hypothetical protein